MYVAEVIQRDGYDFTDDKAYLGFAHEMEAQALDLASAAKAKNYDQARTAAGKLAQACSNCHGGFRN